MTLTTSNMLFGRYYCPQCGAQSYTTQGTIGGKDACQNGHEYRYVDAVADPSQAAEPTQKELM